MNNIRFELNELEKQIADLLAAYPEIAEDETLLMDMLEGSTDFNDVLAKLLDMAQGAASMTEAIWDRQNDLAARKARYERQADGYRSLMQSLMERANLSKVVLAEGTLSISHIKPAPIIADEAALPDECVKLVRKPDMATIKAWVAAGNMPAGVVLSNGKTSLVVRVK